MQNFKTITYIYTLTYLTFMFFSLPMAAQLRDPKPIEPYEMGQIMQKKLVNERLENVVDGLTDLELWSHIMYTDSILEIVYKPVGFEGDLIEGSERYDIRSREFVVAKLPRQNCLCSKS